MTISWVAEAVATRTAAAEHDVPGRRRRIAEAEQHDRNDQQKLRKYKPSPPSAEQPGEQGNIKGIDNRRPQELDGVGRADQCEQTDGAEVNAGSRIQTNSVEPDSASGNPAEKPRNRTMSTRGLR